MTRVGIVGGIAPESTIEYYRLIVRGYRDQKRDGHYPSIVINSIDLTKMLALLADDRPAAVSFLVDELQSLAGAGCDFALFASNTPHVVFADIAAQAPLPLISIVDTAVAAASRMSLRKVGLLGTRFTMQGSFYRDALASRGIDLVVPEGDDQAYVHDNYMGELVHGVFRDETRAGFVRVVERMRQRHAIDGVILGGTEIPLLLRDPAALPVPSLDTTRLHVDEVVRRLVSSD